MKFLVALVLGAIIGVGGFLYYQRHHSDNPQFQRMETNLAAGAETVKQNFDKKVIELRADEIKDELSRSGKVVRQKARELGKVISDATADAQVTAALKGKYAVDSDLSALKISVNTTGGVVTLSGTASSYENIQKAMQLALETDGVREVVSTLQVK